MIEITGKLNKDIKNDIIKVHNEILSLFSLPEKVKVNLSIISKVKIKNLNKSTRNIDKVTDVLSYPYTELKVGEKLDLDDYKYDIDPSDKSLTIGDIYICDEQAIRQSEEYGHSLRREICFLFCHGMLHLLGYDHIKEEDTKLMEAKQEEILSKLNITREKEYQTTSTISSDQSKIKFADISQPNKKADIIYKCGFVTIVGDTNVGKSTLINTLVGEHVAIVTPKTQTTRENIKGIYNDATTQIVFVDTPGYHKRSNKIDDFMESNIKEAMEDTEIIIMMITAKKNLTEQYYDISKKIQNDAKKILVINKIDESSFERLYPQLAELTKIAKVDEILPISAKNGINKDILLDMIKKYLPAYDFEMRYYPTDEYTDKNIRQMVSEIIREKALLIYEDEIPHGVAVQVIQYLENEQPIQIMAEIFCERENHKAIILGKNGEKIKELGIKSRTSIEKFIGEKINLQLHVKAKQNWRNNATMIRELGYEL